MKIPFPKEYGAWGMLIVPFITGISLGRVIDFKILLISVAIILFYLARYPIYLFIRNKAHVLKWGIIYAFAGTLVSLVLIFKYRIYGLVGFGLIFGIFFLTYIVVLKYKSERTIAGEIFGVAGLTMSAPVGYYISTGSLDTRATILWLLNILYFSRSIYYVRMKVAAFITKREFEGINEKIQFAKNTLVYHLLMFTIIIILCTGYYFSKWVLLAFIPVTIETLRGIVNLGPVLNIKKLGYTEMIHSLIFAAILIGGLR